MTLFCFFDILCNQSSVTTFFFLSFGRSTAGRRFECTYVPASYLKCTDQGSSSPSQGPVNEGQPLNRQKQVNGLITSFHYGIGISASGIRSGTTTQNLPRSIMEGVGRNHRRSNVSSFMFESPMHARAVQVQCLIGSSQPLQHPLLPPLGERKRLHPHRRVQ